MAVRTGTYGTRGASGVMDGLVEFRTEDGVRVVVEGVEDEYGARLVSRGDGPVRAARTFESSLEGVRAAAESALRVFRDGTLRPDSVELEFGVKLSAESGAVIAKGSAEGHLVVKLNWSPQPSPTHPEYPEHPEHGDRAEHPGSRQRPDAVALS